MPQAIYDDPSFFDAYSRFPRSAEGLSAAGEWHELQALFPDVTGRRVLDLGCGFGWHCKYAADHGAAVVLGTDISEKMLAGARERNAAPVITYQRMAMEDFDFPDESFDLILSSLALHYVADIRPLFQKIAAALTPGGSFLFSCEHPVFTAYGSQDWYRDEKGNILHWPVDNYYYPGPRQAQFLGHTVTKYHRTVTDYVSALLDAGLRLTALVEPQPAPHLRDQMPDEFRRPMMLILRGEKG